MTVDSWTAPPGTERTDPPRPRPIDDAEQRRDRLAHEVTLLQAELADPDRRDPVTGRRLSRVAYARWRRGVIEALAAKHDELRRLNAWLRAARAARGAGRAAPALRPDLEAFARLAEQALLLAPSSPQGPPRLARLRQAVDALQDWLVLGGEAPTEAAAALIGEAYRVAEGLGLLGAPPALATQEEVDADEAAVRR